LVYITMSNLRNKIQEKTKQKQINVQLKPNQYRLQAPHAQSTE
jgi:hypothetical protein